MTLSEPEVSEVRSLREKGFSYHQISASLGVSPATALKYSCSVELSESASELLADLELRNWGKFAKKYSAEKEIVHPLLDEDFANLLGHLFFDGSVFTCNGKFVLNYTNASKVAIDEFISLLWKCFRLKPAIIQLLQRNNLPIFQVECYSKKAYTFLRSISPSFSTSKNARVPGLIMTSNDSIKSAFLMAFWDDEGCITHNGQLEGCSVSESMIDDLIVMHRGFGIECRKLVCNGHERAPLYRIVIKKSKSNFARFIAKAGFQHAIVAKGHHIGKAKKDLLLEKFIEAYNISASD
ncbi:Uncharacterised protein [uncultured archaeon]|nr:Uncharacterised protein [uncultured archaeon]